MAESLPKVPTFGRFRAFPGFQDEKTEEMQSDIQLRVSQGGDTGGPQHGFGSLHIVDAEDHIGLLGAGAGKGIHILDIDICLIQGVEDRPERAAAVIHAGGDNLSFRDQVFVLQQFADGVGVGNDDPQDAEVVASAMLMARMFAPDPEIVSTASTRAPGWFIRKTDSCVIAMGASFFNAQCIMHNA